MMNCRGFWLGLAVGAVSMCLLGQWVLAAASKGTNPPGCIPAETVAGYVHSVIQADRTFYTTDIVERMQMRGIVVASENWRETARLPLPAQFLLEAILLSAGGGVLGIAVGVLTVPLAASLNQGAALLDPRSIPMAFGVSLGTGLVFGLYPALRASRLDPIEALRYE